ncbi:HNH endonuclease [Evansella sp. AB-rgal1]|uniref:HNH endonuclease n=1 Tax=Evansella sp. AB-rgal1 TaxID=3242696 RepID=UPI00359CC534
MRNLYPYSIPQIFPLKEIVNSKKEPRKSILNNSFNQINQDYKKYLSMVNKLELMNSRVKDYESNESLIALKEALIHCYESSTDPLYKLKAEIKKLQPDDYAAYCQYCGIGIPSTFDHYLPKSIFPEFSVLGINLLPCCTDCNRDKDDKWINSSGLREFLNLYYDSINGSNQYLFCRMIIHDNIPVARFYLNIPNDMNQQDYQVVKNHYNNLGLLNKYSLLSNGEIKKAVRSLNKKYSRNGNFDIIQELKDQSDSEADIYGVNFWKVSLYQSMWSSPQMINLIKSIRL